MDVLWWIVVIAVVVVVVVLVAAISAARRRRHSEGLRQRFGPEYEHTVGDEGRRKGERALDERLARREQLELRELPVAARERYLVMWSATQQRFVDSPVQAVHEAQALLGQVMRDRGYPDDDEAVDLVAVDHPDLVARCREAGRTATRAERGEADTEELRQALVRYRMLFDELLGSSARA
jgi:hypothetical protein